ncbi:MAG: hypothetical protein L3J34_04635 [Flavobacteriaceae bacterium]|nr:hypothetical protein [Flavobacteriaceae bacterium]
MKKKLCYTLILFLFTQVMEAQCAMCRAVVEQGGKEMAEGINLGIIYLMAFPYIIVGVVAYLFYRNWKKGNS